MAQQAQPISDLDNTGSWTSTPLWSKIEEGGSGDGTVILSDTTPVVTEPFTVDLSTITDPTKSTGHFLKIRWAKNAGGGGNKTIRIELREGYVNESTLGTLIATDDYAINSTTLRTDQTELGTSEADAITDYADLQIRVMGVSGNRQLQVDFVELEIVDEADHNQREFRIRDTDPAINANAAPDWAELINVDATIDLDTVFRIRFDIEETGAVSDGGVIYKLQVNKNSTSYADAAVLADTWPPVAQVGATSVVQIINASFADNAATTDLLAAKAGFITGRGSHDQTPTSITLNNQHTELEWAIVIPRYYDGVGNRNNDGDTFDFRVVESDGTLFTGDTNSGYDEIPRVTANLAVGHIGGTHIEQPGNIGPHKDANGNLYYATEQTNATTTILLHKTTDGGDAWVEATATGRPATVDPEGLDGVVVDDDVLHWIHRKGDDSVFYHEYNLSSAPSNPDTWQTIDQSIDAATGGKIASSDDCSIVVRANGDKFAFYTGLVGGNGTIFYKVWEGVSWNTRVEVDTEATTDFTAVWAILDSHDDIQVYYLDFTNEIIYRKEIATGGVTIEAGRTSITANVRANANSFAANMFVDQYFDDPVDVEVLGYIHTGGLTLSSTHVRDGTPQTEKVQFTDNDLEHSQGTSHQPIADFGVEGLKVHLLYGEDTPGLDIFTTSSDDEAAWITDTEEQDAVTCHYIRSQVFTHSSGNGGATVLGYVWDQGSNGDAPGFTRYDEIVLVAGGAAVYPPFPRKQRRSVRM